MLWNTLLRRDRVQEPVIRIQHIVSQVIESVSVEGVGARASHNRDLAARSSTILRSETGRLNFELLNSVDRCEIAEAAASARLYPRTGRASEHTAAPAHADIGAHTVNGEVVRVGPLAIHAELNYFTVDGVSANISV